MDDITEINIKSYMSQFNVNRGTAIKEISELEMEISKQQDLDMQEVYEDIIRSSH